MRTEEQKKFLRKGVFLALMLASVVVFATVLVAGATSEVAFREGSLTAAANCTTWNALTLFAGTSMDALLIPVILVAALVIVWLLFNSAKACFAGSL